MTIGTVTRRVPTWAKFDKTPNRVFRPMEAARFLCGTLLVLAFIFASFTAGGPGGRDLPRKFVGQVLQAERPLQRAEPFAPYPDDGVGLSAQVQQRRNNRENAQPKRTRQDYGRAIESRVRFAAGCPEVLPHRFLL